MAIRFKGELRSDTTEAETASATVATIWPEVVAGRTEAFVESQAAQNANNAHLSCYHSSMSGIAVLEEDLASSRSET